MTIFTTLILWTRRELTQQLFPYIEKFFHYYNRNATRKKKSSAEKGINYKREEETGEITAITETWPHNMRLYYA